MKEIYEELKKNSYRLMTENESKDFWAEFGFSVFKKYLERELLLEKTMIQRKNDIRFLASFIKEEDKEKLSKRLKELIK